MSVAGWPNRPKMGVEIFPGMACSELIYNEDGSVKGVVAGEFGKNPDGTPGPFL